jgi:nucleotide-binding universal stress UspA family protein
MADSTTSTTIVVGADSSEPSLAALRTAALLAHTLSARVVAVFVRQTPAMVAEPTAGEAMVAVEQTLDDIELTVKSDCTTILDGAASWDFHTRIGDPAHEIVAVAHETGATWVVIGSTLHGPVASLLVNSTAEHLLHHCDVNLVIVRPDKVDA